MESAFSVFLEEIKQIKVALGAKVLDEEAKNSTRPYLNDVTNSGNREEFNEPRATLNIFVTVAKAAEVHLSLNTDECYNLTISGEEQGQIALLLSNFNSMFHFR